MRAAVHDLYERQQEQKRRGARRARAAAAALAAQPRRGGGGGGGPGGGGGAAGAWRADSLLGASSLLQPLPPPHGDGDLEGSGYGALDDFADFTAEEEGAVARSASNAMAAYALQWERLMQQQEQQEQQQQEHQQQPHQHQQRQQEQQQQRGRRSQATAAGGGVLLQPLLEGDGVGEQQQRDSRRTVTFADGS